MKRYRFDLTYEDIKELYYALSLSIYQNDDAIDALSHQIVSSGGAIQKAYDTLVKENTRIKALQAVLQDRMEEGSATIPVTPHEVTPPEGDEKVTHGSLGFPPFNVKRSG